MTYLEFHLEVLHLAWLAAVSRHARETGNVLLQTGAAVGAALTTCRLVWELGGGR